MPKVHVDPTEVHHFARFLANAIVDLRARESQISSRFNDLHSKWNDARYDKFDRSFNETLRQLKSFCDASEELVRFLHRKADKTRGYFK